MRGQYYMPDWEVRHWVEILKRDVKNLLEGSAESHDYTKCDICPANIEQILTECMGFEVEERETNGFESECWIYLTRSDIENTTLVLFYCGYTGQIKMYLGHRGDYDN